MILHRFWRSVLFLFCGFAVLLPPVGSKRLTLRKPTPTVVPASRPVCSQLGWFPTNIGLKDHTIFTYGGYYYLASIRIPNEKAFAYARSRDLCHWDDLGTILTNRTLRKWDEKLIWAPFVFEEDGIFYMYYTGVTREFTQTIMLAISTNPADPDSWQPKGMVFYPNHAGSLWGINRWADCRDATILKVDEIYYLYYTARDASGPIIGWATAVSPDGPWRDWGPILMLDKKNTMAESPMIINHAGVFYLVYNNTSRGEEYRIGFTQIGPWSSAFPFRPGWANEIWTGKDGQIYTSYVKNYAIAVDPIHLNSYYSRLLYLFDSSIQRQYFPLALSQ